MTINTTLLIRSLEKPYQAIFEAGVITYRTPPQGTQCDPYLTLDMKSEGIFLAFDNDKEKALSDIALRLRSDKTEWFFPNELPSPLKQEMSRDWVHETFGKPDKSIPPKIVMKTEFGWRERFKIEDFHIPITMIILYDMADMAKSINFLPTSRLRW
ncbi:pyocin immunity protein [Nissabacter archeti]|uniref:Pyocin immunity protein n=1 Tax=Nissabacter archeti TaxID=1917880 RepID=A0ABS5JH94_9GAMM|nr:DUF6392 family protein [Nissabacter archeti]MBS0969351.1 pyocin immunity protein [Nissabacter archeti]